MPTLSLSDLGARAGALLAPLESRWHGAWRPWSSRFIAPIMGVMFIGAVELSQAIIVDRRVTQIASSTADLVARAETTIAQSDITDIMKAGSFIMAPYTPEPAADRHTRVASRHRPAPPRSSSPGPAPTMAPAAR